MAIVFKIEERLKPALEELCRRYEVGELSLFGSAAVGEFGINSDLDFLVEFKPGSRIGLMRFLHLRRELSALFGRKVDLVPKNGLKRRIRGRVLSQARLVYAG